MKDLSYLKLFPGSYIQHNYVTWTVADKTRKKKITYVICSFVVLAAFLFVLLLISCSMLLARHLLVQCVTPELLCVCVSGVGCGVRVRNAAAKKLFAPPPRPPTSPGVFPIT